MVKVNIYSHNRLTEVAYLNPSESERLTKRKKVIDLIRDQPQRYGEISEKTGIAESTVNRILKELKTYGLVEKRDDKYWVWSEYENRWKGSPKEYKALVGHAKDLIPGLKNLLTINISSDAGNHHQDIHYLLAPKQNLSFLSECALDHLIAYPTIHDNLIKLSSLLGKYKETDEKTKKILEVIRRSRITSKNLLLAWRKKFSESIANEALSKRKIPYILGPFLDCIPEGLIKPIHGNRWQVSPLIKNHNGIDKVTLSKHTFYFIKGPVQGDFDGNKIGDFLKIDVSIDEVYGELAKQIYLLILQSHHQPLKGRCKSCPDIKIETESSDKGKLFKNKS